MSAALPWKTSAIGNISGLLAVVVRSLPRLLLRLLLCLTALPAVACCSAFSFRTCARS